MTKVAYLVNQYPKVSHSFIRREIQAIEDSRIEVYCFSIRYCADKLVGKSDKLELEKTKFILDVGILGLLFNLFRTAFTNPIRLLKASLLIVKIGFGKDKGILIHCAYLAEACVLQR